MLPVETVKEISRLATEALKPMEISDGYGRWLIRSDGTKQYLPTPIASKVRHIETFQSFVDLVNTRTEGMICDPDDGEDASGAGPLVPAHEGSCVYYGEDGFKYDENPSVIHALRAKCKLVSSDEYEWLSTQSSKDMNQEAFIRTLRITLRSCFPNTALLTIIREVKFDSTTGVTSETQHGRQSISRSIINEVKGLGTIPEEVQLSVQPYENLPYKATVTCAIEINEKTATFKLTPYPGELTKAIESVLAEAVKRLPEEVPCFRGDL